MPSAHCLRDTSFKDEDAIFSGCFFPTTSQLSSDISVQNLFSVPVLIAGYSLEIMPLYKKQTSVKGI